MAIVATGASFSAVPGGEGSGGRFAPESPVATVLDSTAARNGGGSARVADARISIDQAVKLAEQKYKARVVRAESQDEGGKKVYVLRLLNESGHVWTVKVDAATGTMI